MSKQLADQIEAMRPADRTHAAAWHVGYQTARAEAASLALTFRSARPWKATAEQVAENPNADLHAFWEWARTQPGVSGNTYLMCCAVADAILPPPTFRARVALDQIAEWFANWHEPTAEEVQALFRPKVRELRWYGTSGHYPAWCGANVPDGTYRVYTLEDGITRLQNPGGDVTEHESAGAAQAAAQAHWESRAEEFFREAFV